MNQFILFSIYETDIFTEGRKIGNWTLAFAFVCIYLELVACN